MPFHIVDGILKARILKWFAIPFSLFLTAKFRLKLNKVGKPLDRPFGYDLNQIPYDYTVEAINRFKELDLIDRVPEEPWTEVCDIVQEAVIKTIPQKRKAERQNGCLRRPCKWLRKEKLKAEEKRKNIPV